MLKRQLLRNFVLGIFVLLLMPFSGFSQERTITGKVTDEQANPLPAVSISVKGGAQQTLTDAGGNYSIKISGNDAILTFSQLGFATQEIVVSDRNSIHVTMVESAQQLSEVVVVGYGTQKRKDLTGSVASVNGGAFKNQPITNATEALQGRIAGVNVVKSSGAPDAQPSITIRGTSSLNQPAPLYIIDGVRVPGDGNINVQDIATIDVLKDASAASIYGSAAAGGVILITTKRGTTSAPTVNFSTRYGISTPKTGELLNKDQYIRFQNIVNPQYFTGAAQLDTLSNTNWVDALYRKASEQNYNLSISGAGNKVDYLVSGFYNKQEGVYSRNYSNIGGARVNSNINLGKYLKIGEQVAVSQRKTAPPIGVEAQLHNSPFRTIPILPLYNKDGSYGTAPQGYNGFVFNGINPLASLNAANVENFKNNLQSNVYAQILLPFGLSFKSTFGYSYYNESQNYFQDAFSSGSVSNQNNSLNKLNVESTQLLSNYVLSYDKTIDKHNINAVAGYEQISNKFSNSNVTASNIGLPGYSYIPTSATNYVVSGKTDNNGLIKSFFGRVNYNYAGRYYISGSIRQDANYTVFGPNKQKGVFPSVSAGWNISEESFFKKAVPTVNLLKLRGSYGELGNSNIAPYSYVSVYKQFAANYNGSAGGQNFAPGANLVLANTFSSIPNPNLHWETVKETNIGLDAELLNNSIYFTAEWYNKKTVDLLYPLPVSLSSGITEPYLANVGSVNNKGFDFLAGYRNKVGKLNFDVSVTAGFNKNKVLSLSGVTTDALYDGYNFYSNGDVGFNAMPNQQITISKAGDPFGSFYGYKVLGIFKTDAEAAQQLVNGKPAKAGDLIYENLDDNPEINAADKQIIGNPNPKMVYGLTINLNYKSFDLGLLFNGVAGVDLFNGVKSYEMFPFSGDANTSPKVFNASYFGDNQLTGQPRIGIKNPDGSFTLDQNRNYSSVNSYFVEKGDYFKLKNLQLGYTFSGVGLEKLKVKSARLFVMGNNLLTFTNYSGFDPELGSAFSVAGYNGVTTKGIDAVSQYPQTRIYSIGLDVNF